MRWTASPRPRTPSRLPAPPEPLGQPIASVRIGAGPVECDPGEDPLAAARHEFAGEIGAPAPAGEPLSLGEVPLKAGKR
jgi:predicted NUDIX family NTP pyrophosphohydrolase